MHLIKRSTLRALRATIIDRSAKRKADILAMNCATACNNRPKVQRGVYVDVPPNCSPLVVRLAVDLLLRWGYEASSQGTAILISVPARVCFGFGGSD